MKSSPRLSVTCCFWSPNSDVNPAIFRPPDLTCLLKRPVSIGISNPIMLLALLLDSPGIAPSISVKELNLSPSSDVSNSCPCPMVSELSPSKNPVRLSKILESESFTAENTWAALRCFCFFCDTT